MPQLATIDDCMTRLMTETLEEGLGRRQVVGARKLGATIEEVGAVGGAAVKADVARGLLQRRETDAAVLERFGGERGRLLDRDVGPGELRDGIVSVPDQDPLVKLLGPAHSDHVVIGGRCPCQTLEA